MSLEKLMEEELTPTSNNLFAKIKKILFPTLFAYSLPLAILGALLSCKDDNTSATSRSHQTQIARSVIPTSRTDNSLAGLPGRIYFVSDLYGNKDIFAINPDGTKLKRLTDHAADDYSPSVSPDGKNLAFTSDRDDNKEIYLLNLNDKSHNPINLTRHSFDDDEPAWSPDGKKIYFSSESAYHHDIFVMDADGRNRKRLTTYPVTDSSPHCFPDGKNIVFSSFRSFRKNAVYIMDSEGKHAAKKLISTRGDNDYATSISPDGKKIALTTFYGKVNSEINIFDYDGQNQKRLTFNSFPDYQAYWSPDSKKLVFSSYRENKSRPQLFIMNADGTDVLKIPLQPPADNEAPFWSPK